MSIYFTGPDSLYEPISIQLYSDGTPMVKTGGWSRIVAKADTMVVKAESMAEFFAAMMLADAATLAGARADRLVLPYIPGARQDRSNPTGDVLFAAHSVGQTIQHRFDKVIVLDPHSPVSVEEMEWSSWEVNKIIRVYPLAEVAKRIPNRYAGIIAADKGGKARAEEMAKAMGLPVFYGGKTRDVSTGKLTGFTLDNLGDLVAMGNIDRLEDASFLVVDDICDGGGTFNGLAAKIHEQGATADLYVSHGIFAKGTDELKKNFGTIFTTDSREIHDRNDVTIIPIVKDMEKYN